MSYLDSPEKRKRIQQALADKGFYAGAIDGVLGPQSAEAIIRARTSFNLDRPNDPSVDTDLERELGLLTIQDPTIVNAAKARGLDIIGILKLISTIQQLRKGNIMDGSKPWYLSQTIIANLLAGVGVALTFFHVNFGAADQASTVTAVIEIGTGVSVLWGIVGRLMATKTIGSGK
jgi:peptidoglycan hydrolase-like protein with peptidoglycan-binding domain